MINTKFKMGDMLKVSPNGRVGIVAAVTLYAAGNVNYCLSYKDRDGTPAHEWFEEIALYLTDAAQEATAIEDKIDTALGGRDERDGAPYVDTKYSDRVIMIDGLIDFDSLIAAADIIRNLPKGPTE